MRMQVRIRMMCMAGAGAMAAMSCYAQEMPWQSKPVPLNQQKQKIDAHKAGAHISSHAAPSPSVKPVGWVEWARLPDVNEDTRAKLDTGAKTSSLNANVIKTFKRDGKEFVLFRIDLNRKYREGDKPIEREITRWANIKMKDGKLQKRPVVSMNFCIDHHMFDGEMTLAKRDTFNYSVLVGRNMLSGAFAVDVSRTFTTKPRCK